MSFEEEWVGEKRTNAMNAEDHDSGASVQRERLYLILVRLRSLCCC